MFSGCLISSRGDAPWPARSPDLATCDFFVWGQLKAEVFKPRPRSLPDLRNAIQEEIGLIPQEMLVKVMQNFRSRIQQCIDSEGHHLRDTIPCSCGAVYIGTTQRSFKTRISEHRRNCRLGYIDKSAVAEHAYLEGEHKIRFEDADTLSDTPHFYARLHREAIEIYKHKNNFNRKEEGLKVNKAWYPALRKTNIKPARVAQLNNTTPDAERVENSKPTREAHSSAD
ncbi:hypothetical protein ANN_02492 [Periplaneta americana]|uniref:GIY-YIG domain-containing protein n=1 Tax=Periplaneta americana TaxID=6978 RepID=A0ABQ8TZP6_PERAM|nr:hypothetical protein ANN_02492 [Periplaneta americana]